MKSIVAGSLRLLSLDPEVLQSGFGSIFFVGLANFRSIAHEFLSELFSEYFPQNFRPCFSRVGGLPIGNIEWGFSEGGFFK